MTEQSTAPKLGFRLLDLPLELRQLIYQFYFFPRDLLVYPQFRRMMARPLKRHISTAPEPPESRTLSLAYVSKALHEEALDVLYHELIYTVELDNEGIDILKKLDRSPHAKRVRQLMLIADGRIPKHYSYHERHSPTEVEEQERRSIPKTALVDLSFLAQITKFHIVLFPPRPHHSLSQSAAFAAYDNQIDAWCSWLKPLLDCTREKLQAGATVLRTNQHPMTHERLGLASAKHFYLSYSPVHKMRRNVLHMKLRKAVAMVKGNRSLA